MKVNVNFPSVMKMQLRAEIEFDDNAKLMEIKEKILEKFWQIMSPLSSIGPHGSADLVILRDEYDLEITSEEQLQERIKESSQFSAVFQEHPFAIINKV